MSNSLIKSSFPPGPDAPVDRALRVGLLSDTHGVLCPEVLQRLRGADLILHAGDVGHHGGATEILAQLAEVAPVYAVRGNVDDESDSCGDGGQEQGRVDDGDGDVGGAAGPRGGDAGVGGVGVGGVGCGSRMLPSHRLLEAAGWRILVTHIVGQPPQQVDPAAADLICRHQPHIVVFGHSHKHAAVAAGGRRYYNPGSAGPARFKLPRTAALLKLPRRCAPDVEGGTADGAEEPEPVFTLMTLHPKAPPRLTAAKQPHQRQRPNFSSETTLGPPRPTRDGDGGGGCAIGELAPSRRGRVRCRAAGRGLASAGAGYVSEGPEVDEIEAEAGNGEGGHTLRRRGREGGVGARACGAPARQATTGKRRRADGTS